MDSNGNNANNNNAMKIKYIKNGLDYEAWMLERGYSHEDAAKEVSRVTSLAHWPDQPYLTSDESWFFRVAATRTGGARLLGRIRLANYSSSNSYWQPEIHKPLGLFDNAILKSNEAYRAGLPSAWTLTGAKSRLENYIVENGVKGGEL
tara:strand:+ start:2097 stop:2540 length:444 start_codon:yes stop_codon:yes gene_type:complete